MIPEPFTATVASIGILSTVLTTIITSAKNIYHVRKEWTLYWYKLVELQQRLQNCHEKMRLLTSTWALNDDGHRESDYTYLFGCDSLEHITNLIAVVHACEEDISRSLRKYYRELGEPEQLSPGATKDWLRTFVLKSNERALVMRLLFALVTGDELDRKVKALADQSGTLEDFLKMRFEQIPDLARYEPNIAKKSSVTEFLGAIIGLRDHGAQLTGLLSRLLQSAWEAGILCSLVPRLKDQEGHFTRLMDRYDLTITLSLQHPDCCEPEYRQLSQVTFPLEEKATPAELLAKLSTHGAKGTSSVNHVILHTIRQ